MKGKLKLHYGRKNRGQALLLMILLMGVVFIGMLGFAIDMSRMYAQRQMAQAAADAAAQAAISSIKGGTNTRKENKQLTTPRTCCCFFVWETLVTSLESVGSESAFSCRSN